MGDPEVITISPVWISVVIGLLSVLFSHFGPSGRWSNREISTLRELVGKCMTFDQHEEICTRHDGEIKAALVEIKNSIEKRDEIDREFRHNMNDKMNALNAQVAVIAALTGVTTIAPNLMKKKDGT